MNFNRFHLPDLKMSRSSLTNWGRVTHICVGNLTIIGSDNGLSPCRRQAIIWTNAGILLIRTSGTNFSEILGEIHSFSFSKMHLKMSSGKWRLFGLGLNVLITWQGAKIVAPTIAVRRHVPVCWFSIWLQTNNGSLCCGDHIIISRQKIVQSGKSDVKHALMSVSGANGGNTKNWWSI